MAIPAAGVASENVVNDRSKSSSTRFMAFGPTLTASMAKKRAKGRLSTRICKNSPMADSTRSAQETSPARYASLTRSNKTLTPAS